MFHTLVLDRLSEAETRDAIMRPIEIKKSTLTFTDQTISRIIEESRGYPFLIQYICREVFDAWIGRMTIGAAPSVPMKEITAKLDLDFFAPRWNRATDRQQIFMQVIATLEEADGEFTIQDITAASRKLLTKPFNPSHATQMLGHLAEKGLIYRNRRGSYCFAVPLWPASFVAKHGTQLLDGSAHLLAAAFLAISFRRFAVIPFARAFPPIRPSATAAAFLPSSVTLSSISPVAIRATMTARWFASAGRFSPFGPFAMSMV